MEETHGETLILERESALYMSVSQWAVKESTWSTS